MKNFRTLALAGLALVAAGPAVALERGPVAQLDNATQMQDDLFRYQRLNGIDAVAAPVGIPATTASIAGGPMPFWANHEAVRLEADND